MDKDRNLQVRKDVLCSTQTGHESHGGINIKDAKRIQELKGKTNQGKRGEAARAANERTRDREKPQRT